MFIFKPSFYLIRWRIFLA